MRKIGYFLVSIITILLIILYFNGTDLSVPFVYAGDALFSEFFIKSIIDHGWYLTNPSVGAPFGTFMHDYPMSDNFFMLLILLLSKITTSPAYIINIFYLFSYLLTSITAYAVFNYMKINPFFSISGAILYSFLPYHYMRGESHLFLSSYYIIPLVILVILWLWDEANINKRKLIFSMIVSIIVACSGIYYAFFSAFFVFVTILIKILNRDFKNKKSFLILGIIILTVGINLSPTLIYTFNEGHNPGAVQRGYGEAEIYGLKITQLLLPADGYRIDKIDELKQKYNLSTPLNNENQTESLGFIGVSGFIILLLLLFKKTSNQILMKISYLNISSILLATIGGFSSIIALLLTPDLRGYNRISVFIAYFALLTILLIVDSIIKKKSLIYIVSVVVLTLGLYDQVTSNINPQTETYRSLYQNDSMFVKQIESSAPKGSMIFQLPYFPFPESPAKFNLGDYSLFRPYLHSHSLKWSYGGVKGRTADQWSKYISQLPISELVKNITYSGFNGILLNRFGFEDNGKQLESELFNILYKNPIVSNNQELVYFDLTTYANQLRTITPDWNRMAEKSLSPLLVSWKDGFYDLEGSEFNNWRWSSSEGTLIFHNLSTENKLVEITMNLSPAFPENATLNMTGIIDDTINLERGGTLYSKEITLLPGNNFIKFHTNAKRLVVPNDPRDLRFRITNFKQIEK
jgi:phosphoglycerol transferase